MDSSIAAMLGFAGGAVVGYALHSLVTHPDPIVTHRHKVGHVTIEADELPWEDIYE